MKAIGFDLGDTLIFYENIPMNWKELYRAALLEIIQELNMPISEGLIHKAEKVLSLYNTRLHPREHEVTDTEIFGAIYNEWGIGNRNLERAIEVFFGFFQQQSQVYEDTLIVLQELKSRDVSIGILTDVPYGMRKEFVLRDIAPLREYIDVVVTSTEVGYRKPRAEGYTQLARQLGITNGEMIYTGNEEKDIIGANRAGLQSALITRDRKARAWGQQRTISTLMEILEFLDGR